MYFGEIRALSGILVPPLLNSDAVALIEFVDGFGDVIAVFVKQPANGWLFMTKNEKNWGVLLSCLGLASANYGDGRPGRIRCTDRHNKLLLLDHTITIIEYRGSNRRLKALFSRHFNDDMWIFVNDSDDTWTSELVRLGYKRPPYTTRDVLNTIRAEKEDIYGTAKVT